VSTNEKISNLKHTQKSNVEKIKSLEEKFTCCKHDLKKIVESSKALNILFSNSKHAFDKCSYKLKGKKEKRKPFLKNT